MVRVGGKPSVKKPNSDDELIRKTKKGFKIGIFVLIALIVVFGSYRQVDSGERKVVLRLGEVNRVMQPGPNFKIPLFESTISYETRTVKYEAEATAASKDLQDTRTKVALNYHLEPTRVDEMYTTFGSNYQDTFIAPAIQEVVKSSTAQFNAEELITKRAMVKDKVEFGLRERLGPRGITLESVSITDFDFSEEFNKAIESKVTAQQLALKAENDLKRVEFEAKQRVAQAQGEAEAIKAQAEAIQHQGGAEYVKLKAIERWNGILPMITSSNSLPFIQIPGLEQIKTEAAK